MNNKHYFFKLNGSDFQLKHEKCTSEFHEIKQFKIMSDYIIHEYNHPRTLVNLKIISKDTNELCNLGVSNWTDINDESFGLLTVDKNENVTPLPLILTENVKFLEMKLKAPTAVYMIDIISSCEFQVVKRSEIFPHEWNP